MHFDALGRSFAGGGHHETLGGGFSLSETGIALFSR